MESLLERKNLEKAVLERRLSSKPSPELASYIEGFKIGQVSEEISRAGLGGGMSGSSQSQLPVFSQFLHDSAAVASGHHQLSVPSSPDQAAAAAGARARRLRQQEQQPAPSTGGRSGEAASVTDLLFAALDKDGVSHDSLCNCSPPSSFFAGFSATPRLSHHGHDAIFAASVR